MHEYAASLKNLFEENANPSLVAAMAAYMRNQFNYLGIKTPQSVELQKRYYAEHGLPALDELDLVLRDLWALPEREYQYVAIGLLGKFEKMLPEDFVQTIEDLLVTKPWWDTVDTLASGAVGTHFRRFPNARKVYLARWRKSDNFWLRRTCILFQLGYKMNTDFPLLCEIIRENLGSKEFFINKAIGWALRQYSRVDADAVRIFVEQTTLQPLSAREALKWLEKKPKLQAGYA